VPKLPIISGQTAVKTFIKIGYQIIRQKGSHIRLHHKTRRPLTIPNQISIDEFIKLI